MEKRLKLLMSKRKNKKTMSMTVYDVYRKVRKFFHINPGTQVHKSKKLYNRARDKQRLKKKIQREEA